VEYYAVVVTTLGEGLEVLACLGRLVRKSGLIGGTYPWSVFMVELYGNCALEDELDCGISRSVCSYHSSLKRNFGRHFELELGVWR